MQMEEVKVPKVEMVEETVMVPDVRIERQHKMMPVTVTRLVPVQQQEVVMRYDYGMFVFVKDFARICCAPKTGTMYHDGR